MEYTVRVIQWEGAMLREIAEIQLSQTERMKKTGTISKSVQYFIAEAIENFNGEVSKIEVVLLKGHDNPFYEKNPKSP